MDRKTVLSYEFVNVLVMTNDDIKKTLDDLSGIAPTDYSILQKLLVLNRPVGLTEYYGFLLLRKNTISTAVARLESAGYLVKEADTDDLRRCRVSITEKGRVFAHEASVAIRKALLKDFWKTFDDERVNWGMEVDSKAYLASDAAFEEACAALQSEEFVVPSWVTALRYLEQLWTEVLRTRVSLSLSEFRTLDLLEVRADSLSSVEISEALHLEASAVSRVTRTLCNRGLVDIVRSKVDRRSARSSLTVEGRALLAVARRELREATDAHYAGITDQEREGLVGWHKKMFSNFTL